MDPPNGIDPWKQRNVLCFDGGGVRGYFSLLVLKRLMEWVKDFETGAQPVEREALRPVQSSFDPCAALPNASHLPESERSEITPFLPCHYFDYICGTSTGGLITIMLARLRMPVDDCIHEYETLAGRVFGHPRKIHKFGILGLAEFTKKTKYKTARLEEAIKDVIGRRGEIEQDQYDETPFESEKGFCRAVVYAERQQIGRPNPGDLNVPYVMRSYHNFSKAHRSQPHMGRPRPRNPGKATKFALWKVARATTAADLYFSPLKISLVDGSIVNSREATKTSKRTQTGLSRTGSGFSGFRAPAAPQPQVVYLTDAGAGHVNNPAQEALTEVRSILRDNQVIKTFVSIGTARAREDRDVNATFLGVLRRVVHTAGDPGHVHDRVSEESVRDGFGYFRFNEENGLPDMAMDEWTPSGSGNGSGGDTLRRIRVAVDAWAARAENSAALQRCARELVLLRRQRSGNMPLWERYATGRYYVCTETNCTTETDEMWTNSLFLEHHLRVEHSLPNPFEALGDCVGGQWTYKPPRP